MATVLVIGDGPAGLSAALLLARGRQHTVVLAQDETPMHHAELHNYLGITDILGSDFQEVARTQVLKAGAEIREQRAVSVALSENGLTVRAEADSIHGDYIVLAGGKGARSLANPLGIQIVDGRIPVDADQRTTVDRVYAVGRATRPHRSQAVISAGAGAIAALDILSREAGRDVHDWDNAPAHDHDHPGL